MSLTCRAEVVSYVILWAWTKLWAILVIHPRPRFSQMAVMLRVFHRASIGWKESWHMNVHVIHSFECIMVFPYWFEIDLSWFHFFALFWDFKVDLVLKYFFRIFYGMKMLINISLDVNERHSTFYNKSWGWIVSRSRSLSMPIILRGFNHATTSYEVSLDVQTSIWLFFLVCMHM